MRQMDRHCQRLVLGTLLALGCGGSGKNAGPAERAAPATPANAAVAGNGNTAQPNAADNGFQLPNGPIFQANYDIEVRALNIGVCKGNARLLVNKNFTFELPEARINCLANLCQFDLAGALGGMSQGQNSPNLITSAQVANGVLKLAQVMGATFTPPRPLFLLPFSLSRDELARLSITENTTVSSPSGQDSGSISLKVNSMNEHYTASNGVVYDDVMRWQLTAEGFPNTKPKHFLFDIVKVAWNLKTIAIPEVEISGRLKELMNLAGGGAGGAGSGATGGCNIPGLGGLGGSGGVGGGILGGGILGSITNVITEATNFTATLKLRDQTNLDPTKP